VNNISSHTHNRTRWKICGQTSNKNGSQAAWISHLSAEGRLHAIERRLERDPELKVQYHNFMKACEELGHMEPVKSLEGRHTLLSTTSSSLQGNKYHNKDSSCVRWKCQDFQWIVTKLHITSGSYCSTGSVFHCTAVQNPSGVLHS